MSGAVNTLGDLGPKDDASYTGDVSNSAWSMDYYRSKITDFQSVLQAVDQGYRAAQSALASGGLDATTADELQVMCDDYLSRRFTLKATAEAINAGAAAFNAMGGRLPSLSIPAGLGLAPALPFAAIAAIGTAAVLISWGRDWIRGVNDRLKTAQLLAAQESPEKAASLAQSIAQSDAAIAIAENSGVAALAPVLKWGAFALGAWLLWKALHGAQKSAD